VNRVPLIHACGCNDFGLLPHPTDNDDLEVGLESEQLYRGPVMDMRLLAYEKILDRYISRPCTWSDCGNSSDSGESAKSEEMEDE